MEAAEDEALRGPPLADGCAAGDGAEVGRAEGALALLNDGVGLSTCVDVSDHGVQVEVRPAELLVRRQGCQSCTSRSALQAR
jgi:hypothetical protein